MQVLVLAGDGYCELVPLAAAGQPACWVCGGGGSWNGRKGQHVRTFPSLIMMGHLHHFLLLLHAFLFSCTAPCISRAQSGLLLRFPAFTAGC